MVCGFTGRRRFIFLGASIFAILVYINLVPHSNFIGLSRHEIEAHEFPNLESSPRDTNGFLNLPIAQAYCKAHHFDVFQPRTSRRKVYDLFLINTELDWLEVRLNELKDHVDYFVILESRKTFTGKEKPLHVKQNWERFSDFHDKIILRVLDDGALQGERFWDREDLQRNALFDQVLGPDAEKSLSKNQRPNTEDVILVSDIDEIPKPSALTLLRNCQYPIRLTLRSRFYYYSFQWLHVGEEWAHPQATVYRGNDTIRPADLRNGEGNYAGKNKLTLQFDKDDLHNASWHCSTCFATIDEVVTKMNSFSHQGWNLPEYRERAHIVNAFRNGLDLFNRAGETYEKIPGRNWDIPQFLVNKTESTQKGWDIFGHTIVAGKKKTVGGEGLEGGRFEYMLNRDPENANFKDFSIVDAIGESHLANNAADGSSSVVKASEGVKGGEGISPEHPDIPGVEEAPPAP